MVKFIKNRQQDGGCQWPRGRGNGELVFIRTELHFHLKDEKILEMDGWMVVTAI